MGWAKRRRESRTVHRKGTLGTNTEREKSRGVSGDSECCFDWDIRLQIIVVRDNTGKEHWDQRTWELLGWTML